MVGGWSNEQYILYNPWVSSGFWLFICTLLWLLPNAKKHVSVHSSVRLLLLLFFGEQEGVEMLDTDVQLGRFWRNFHQLFPDFRQLLAWETARLKYQRITKHYHYLNKDTIHGEISWYTEKIKEYDKFFGFDTAYWCRYGSSAFNL